MPTYAELEPEITAWIAQDPDPDTRRELAVLLDRARTQSDALAELADRFAGRLQFGTAGLRGALGAGPNRMNRVVVGQAAAGLAAYLRSTIGTRASVVIGYDGRRNSEVFAYDTAQLLQGAGVAAQVLPRPLPTPVLAYAIRRLGCDAGVMVTASHNPPEDNGYKVYLGDGCQIVPPADREIADAIAQVGPIDSLPRSDQYAVLDDSVVDGYVHAAAELAGVGPRDVRCVYTPLHGVGEAIVARVTERAGFPALHTVAEQREPDAEFPTVPFPNPEEPGAMDLALALARDVDADLVIANDPDADRCAVGVRDAHGWRMLSGDETGVLLADALLRRGVTGTYATTIVSSTLLSKLAADYGQRYAETLTGFKWIGRVSGLVFGYEEALGYAAAPEIARDKDGITALVRVLELAAELKSEGRSLLDRLDEIAAAYGVHATSQLALRVADLTRIDAVMTRLRTAPPTELGGLGVRRVTDLREPTGDLAPTDGLRFDLADDARVVVRPSGTEPKLKCYLEAVVAVADDDEGVAAARIVAAGRLDAMRADLAAVIDDREP